MLDYLQIANILDGLAHDMLDMGDGYLNAEALMLAAAILRSLVTSQSATTAAKNSFAGCDAGSSEAEPARTDGSVRTKLFLLP